MGPHQRYLSHLCQGWELPATVCHKLAMELPSSLPLLLSSFLQSGQAGSRADTFFTHGLT